MEIDNPLVDVVMPTHDRDPWHSIQSVLDQSFRSWHLYVVNDGDRNLQRDVGLCIRGSVPPGCQFTLVSPSQRHRGASAARNEVLDLGKGEFIAYLDDDDTWYPNHLEILLEFLQSHPEIDIVFSKAWAILESGCEAIRAEVWVEELEGGRKKGVLPAPYYQPKMIYKDNVAPTLTFLHWRSCLERVERWDESLPCLNDWDWWARMVLAGYRMAHVDEFTGEYRVHGKGIISQNPILASEIAEKIKQRFFQRFFSVRKI